MNTQIAYNNLTGIALRRLSRNCNPNWETASNRMLRAAEHFEYAGNYAEAEKTLRIWYVEMGARSTAGMADILIGKLRNIGFTDEVARAAEKYLNHTNVV